LIYVPPIHMTDLMVTDPVAWLKREMKIYTGIEDEDA
jgi:hypothetical protein